MKKLYFILTLLLISGSFSAQDLFTCYDEWRKVFENRGADPVSDGEHDNVVVTVRLGDEAMCYTGKAIVKNGLIVKVFLYFDDETAEEEPYEWETIEFQWTVYNGISKTRKTKDDEMVNIMFTDLIKPKKKKLKEAPKPNFDLN